jgi:hypothetical protein
METVNVKQIEITGLFHKYKATHFSSISGEGREDKIFFIEDILFNKYPEINKIGKDIKTFFLNN